MRADCNREFPVVSLLVDQQQKSAFWDQSHKILKIIFIFINVNITESMKLQDVSSENPDPI